MVLRAIPLPGPSWRPELGPKAGKDDVELYVRTYSTILRSSGDVKLRALLAAHIQVRSSLHPGAGEAAPDAGALIYAAQRLPDAVARVNRVILGQEGERFRALLGPEVSRWSRVEAPARRRQWRWDGAETMTVHVASASDLDDVIPCLVAYQLEWNKLHDLLQEVQREPDGRRLLQRDHPSPEEVSAMGARLGLAADDWQRLQGIWSQEFWERIRQIAAQEKDMSVRLLGGHDVGYTRLVRRWWQPIGAALAARGLAERPLYFISSNMHGVVNLVSGYALRRAAMLWDFLENTREGEQLGEIEELRALRGKANAENVLYYAARLWHRYHPEAAAKEERSAEEEARGIVQINPGAGFEVGAQLVELARLQAADFDPRLAELAGAAGRSDAVLLNVDYPLGLASYHILREVVAEVPSLRGAYAIGKAATLNGAVGDVMIANVAFDEHSGNTYVFDNAFAYQDVAPYLERGSVLDNQKAVTVRGTFLQNREYLELFYRELFTVVEMEAGPLLSALYEASHPTRHPTGEHVHFRDVPFDFGLIHYASDTPYTQARTLGSRSLSFEGIDSTYAATVAVLRRILGLEARRLGLASAA
ncbi:MAG TPA: hypothetical protein VHS99_22915 [Chloroflexota bacterium]|jgi:hypothetical protein|nr:hypothetical protein [Chloroflexota bacterium]